MEVKIQRFKDITVAFVRHTGPYKDVGVAWQKLCRDSQVIEKTGPESLAIGICYDDPEVTLQEKIRYDACTSVDTSFQPGDGIGRQTIDGGEYAVMLHKGSFDELLKSYRWFYGEWLPSSGREIKSGPSFEIYRTDPDKVPSEEMVIEIRFPLEQKD